MVFGMVTPRPGGLFMSDKIKELKEQIDIEVSKINARFFDSLFPVVTKPKIIASYTDEVINYFLEVLVDEKDVSKIECLLSEVIDNNESDGIDYRDTSVYLSLNKHFYNNMKVINFPVGTFLKMYISEYESHSTIPYSKYLKFTLMTDNYRLINGILNANAISPIEYEFGGECQYLKETGFLTFIGDLYGRGLIRL